MSVHGDFTSWNFKIRLKRLPDSDLFYTTLAFEEDARLDYLLIVNTKEILDPNNPSVSPSGYGDHSELAMPGFVRSGEYLPTSSIRKGTVTSFTHSSRALGYSRTVFVYLPAGYDTARSRFATIYFQDGSDYINFAKAPTVLDNLIASGSIPPVIGVFVVPPAEPNRNRKTEYALNDAYVNFFTTELIPFVDKKYNTKQTAADRYVIGDSYGGLMSLYIGFVAPDSVGNVASQSGRVSFRNDTLWTMFKESHPKRLRIYLDVGKYERNVGESPGCSGEGDFHAANQRLKRILHQQGYMYHFREFNDGHSWSRWRNELPYILRWFLSATQ
ncbi:esterase family protein [Sphingobacteriales bacterium CHB3]|nr:esterase family protein [Sphingobacteriales bacterium CHB3]